jgi:hypothetical protein
MMDPVHLIKLDGASSTPAPHGALAFAASEFNSCGWCDSWQIAQLSCIVFNPLTEEGICFLLFSCSTTQKKGIGEAPIDKQACRRMKPRAARS